MEVFQFWKREKKNMYFAFVEQFLFKEFHFKKLHNIVRYVESRKSWFLQKWIPRYPPKLFENDASLLHLRLKKYKQTFM